MEKTIFTVYAIKSEVDNRIYVGFTQDLNRRLKEHNSGATRSTKAYCPWNLIFTDRITARKCEKYWKSGVDKEYLKKL